MPPRTHHALRRAVLTIEHLESRALLAVAPSATEQLFLERLNDARANPAAYGQAIGLDLSGVAPAQPLAFNTNLVQAARDHSQDMNDRRFFAHVNPSGLNPGQRLRNVGFAWTGYGESLAAGVEDPAEALRLLIVDAGVADLGHRRQLLSIDSSFRGHTQVGVGAVVNGSGPYRHYYTIDSGQTADTRPFLTGVVMNDANGNNLYDIGEGQGGVTVTVWGVGSVTSFASGGYALPLGPGTYTVTASGGGLAGAVTRTVTVGSTNVRLNLTPDPNQPPLLDYTDAVRRLYETALGRTPAAAEIAPWAQAMAQPNGPTLVAMAIEHSHEARTRLVKSWYQTYLGREALASEEQGWVAALGGGVTEELALAGILGSQEFYNRAGATLGTVATDESFVGVLFQRFLGRTAGASEVASFIRNFVTPHGRGVSALIVLGSSEYRGAQIISYYINILGRPAGPGASEVASWVNSGIDLGNIRIGFEGSNEFVTRR